MLGCINDEQEPTLADDLHPLLPYIMKLQDGQARLETKVDSLNNSIPDMHKRVSSLETDRSNVKAVAGAAGVAGGFIGWLFHFWVKATS